MPFARQWVKVSLLFGLLGTALGAGTRILDLEHQSRVFGETRHYRIFLPPGYDASPEKRYPVIYFFHGWGERYNQGPREGRGSYDAAEDYDGDNIAAFVEKNPVIVVKWDGYNPRTPGEEYPRPYNIGPVETHRQFAVYFPEFVKYIDSTYRTIADREHRGISGLSMGGFMAFWVGGKYPHLVGSISNFMGSPEFVVGPGDFPTEYLHTDMYRNYEGVRTRLVMGSRDFIRWYHAQMNRIWDFLRPSYEHQIFDWDHGTPGMAKQLQFHLDAFEDPLPEPRIWHHFDVYPTFEVWGYSVATDRHRPGFTLLENVSRSGFRSSVREWLPDGQTMPDVGVNLATERLYRPAGEYELVDVNLRTGAVRRERQRADAAGRLHIRLDGDLHEVGITESETPVLTLAQFGIANADWATAGKRVELDLHLLNKGTAPANLITVTLTSRNKGVEIPRGDARAEHLTPGQIRISPGFCFEVKDREQAAASFDLHLTDETGQTWIVPFEVRLFPEVGEFENVEIADGRRFAVQLKGNRIEETLLGIGNGDGEVNPGESVVAVIRDQGVFRLLSLHSGDHCVNPSGLNQRFSDYWGNYDHVGGSAKYSMPTIAASCPPGHEVPFFAEFLVPNAPEHLLKRGIVKMSVTGADRTAPSARSLALLQNNVIQVQLIEGGAVTAVSATISRVADPSFVVGVELNDGGLNGDRAAGDTWFSAVAPDLPESAYRITLEMTDDAGNSRKETLDLVKAVPR
jgi:hypothetical protein